jgi:hypothetical protein
MTTQSVARAVRRDLRRLPAADRGGALAASALALAGLLDSVTGDQEVCECGGFVQKLTADKRLTSAAQAARELRGTMGELMKDASREASGIDDLRARRAARAAGKPAPAAAVAPRR